MFNEKDFDGLTDDSIKEILFQMENADKIFSRINEQLDILSCLPQILSNELSVSLVGGALRDLLCGCPIKDLDLLVSGPANVKINESYKSLFDNISMEKRERFLMEVENKLKGYGCLKKDDSFSENDLFLYLEHHSEPDAKLKFTNINVLVNEISIDMFYFILKDNVENILKAQKIKFKSDFNLDKTSEEKELEIMYLDNKNALNPKNNDKFNKYLIGKEKFLLEYSIIKGVKSIIKINKDDDLNVDLIFSFLKPCDFVKTFDINLLKMFSVVSDKNEKVKDMESLLKSISFNEDAISGYKNKIIEFCFYGNELIEYGDKRANRYEARIKKNKQIFKDFAFKALIDNNLIYQNSDGVIKTSSIDDLMANHINIDMFNLASNIVWKTLLNDEKSVKNSDVKCARKIVK